MQGYRNADDASESVVAMLSNFKHEMSQQFELLLARLDRQDELLVTLKSSGALSDWHSIDQQLYVETPLSNQPGDEEQKYQPSQINEFNQAPVATKKTSESLSRHKKYTKLQKFAQSMQFEMFFGILIVFNAVWIGWEVEYQAKHAVTKSPLYITIVMHFFSAAFLIELITRIAADKGAFLLCTHRDIGWNIFDIILVGISGVEFTLFCLGRLDETQEGGNLEGPGNLQSLRLLRIFRAIRLMRLLRIARILRLVRALRVLVTGIITTVKSLVWAMLLLTTIMYFFAILFTKATTEYLVDTTGCSGMACEGHDGSLWQAFGTIPRSMFTLFKAVSNGIDWGYCTETLAKVNGFLVAGFIMFIAFAYFAVLNVVTGVFCQKAIESAQRDRELAIQTLMENKEAHVTNIKAQFARMFERMDLDKSGTVSFDEFQAHMDDDRVSGFFILLDIDTSDAFALFKLLDDDGSGAIDADEFVDGCLRLQGAARSIDLAKVRHEFKSMLKRIHNASYRHAKRFDDILAHQELYLETIARKTDEIILQSAATPCDATGGDSKQCAHPELQLSGVACKSQNKRPKPHKVPPLKALGLMADKPAPMLRTTSPRVTRAAEEDSDLPTPTFDM